MSNESIITGIVVFFSTVIIWILISALSGPHPIPTEAEFVAYERMAKAIATANGECK